MPGITGGGHSYSRPIILSPEGAALTFSTLDPACAGHPVCPTDLWLWHESQSDTVEALPLYPEALSNEGAIAVGYDSTGLSLVWTRQWGARTFPELLTNAGVPDIEGWSFNKELDISSDGRTIVGGATKPDNTEQLFILELPFPGDTNGDEAVDINDLNNVRNDFGLSGPGLPADLDFDGDVDLVDLNAVRNFFGEAGPQAVPEPTSVILLGAMLACTFPFVRSLTRANK